MKIRDPMSLRHPVHTFICSYGLLPLMEEIRLKIFGSPDYPFPGFPFEWRGLRLLKWNPVWNFGDSHENVFDMYGDSCENLLEILAVVMILSPISSVCGASSDLSCIRKMIYMSLEWCHSLCYGTWYNNDWRLSFVWLRHYSYELGHMFLEWCPSFIGSWTWYNTHWRLSKALSIRMRDVSHDVSHERKETSWWVRP